VITTPQSAELAWRSPPRSSRTRLTFPEEAWIGATPQRCAQAASERIRQGFVPGGHEKRRRGVNADAVDLEQLRGGLFDQLAKKKIQALSFGV
jgi:hypothetical protein